jgi:hypothetical protein
MLCAPDRKARGADSVKKIVVTVDVPKGTTAIPAVQVALRPTRGLWL